MPCVGEDFLLKSSSSLGLQASQGGSPLPQGARSPPSLASTKQPFPFKTGDPRAHQDLLPRPVAGTSVEHSPTPSKASSSGNWNNQAAWSSEGKMETWPRDAQVL